jgi:hypothetical protein
MKVFIPISDKHLEQWPAQQLLVPYRPGLALASQVTIEANDSAHELSRGAAQAGPRDEPPARTLCRP